MVRSEESGARLLGHVLGQPLTNSVTLSRFLQIQCLFPDLDLLMLFMNPRLRKPNLLHNSNERNRAFILLTFFFFLYTQVVLVVKNLTTDEGDVRDAGSIPGSGQSPGGGHNTTLQYSCLENPMDRGAWGLQSIELQSQTQLKQLSMAQHLLFLAALGLFCWLQALSGTDKLLPSCGVSAAASLVAEHRLYVQGPSGCGE